MLREPTKSEVYGQPKVEKIEIMIPLADYDLSSELHCDGSTQLNLNDHNRWIIWKVQLDKSNRASLKLKLNARKLGHLPRNPVVKCMYEIANYSVSGLSTDQIALVNTTSPKFMQKISYNVEKVVVEIRN